MRSDDKRAYNPRRDREELVSSIVTSVIAETPYVMRQRRFLGRKRDHLEVVIESADGTPLTVNDCAGVTRTLAERLALNRITAGQYAVEVAAEAAGGGHLTLGSAVGERIKVKTRRLVDGQKWFVGPLLEATDTTITVLVAGDKRQEILREDIVNWTVVA